MTRDPDRKPGKSDARTSGMVAAAVLIFLAVFTMLFVMWTACMDLLAQNLWAEQGRKITGTMV